MRQIDTPRGPVSIRTTCADDAPRVRQLRLEALAAHPTSFSQVPDEIDGINWNEIVNGGVDGNDAVFVASAGEQFVGMAGIYRGKKIKERHRAGIWGVYLHPDWRGHGIAGALLDAAVAWAAERSAKIVHLMVETTNATAISCYHRHGFRISGVERATIQVDGRCYDEFLMYRLLDGER